MARGAPGSRTPRNRRRLRAVVIGASAGGFEALRKIFSRLSPGLRAPVIVVLHSAAVEASLAESYARGSALPVSEATERTRIEPGRIYIAPAGYHLLVEKNEHFSLSVDERVRYSRPSVDVLFESAADVWRSALIGVIITGANDDGARGLAAIRSHQGVAIVQAPDDAEVPDMPAAAIKLAGADHVVKLSEIAPLINKLAGATAK